MDLASSSAARSTSRGEARRTPRLTRVGCGGWHRSGPHRPSTGRCRSRAGLSHHHHHDSSVRSRPMALPARRRPGPASPASPGSAAPPSSGRRAARPPASISAALRTRSGRPGSQSAPGAVATGRSNASTATCYAGGPTSGSTSPPGQTPLGKVVSPERHAGPRSRWAAACRTAGAHDATALAASPGGGIETRRRDPAPGDPQSVTTRPSSSSEVSPLMTRSSPASQRVAIPLRRAASSRMSRVAEEEARRSISSSIAMNW